MGKMSTGLKRCAGYGLALAVCAVLAGCAGQRAEDGGQKTEDRAAKSAPEKKPIRMIPVPEISKSTLLTTEAIYDPLHDPKVRQAYHRLYQDGTKIIYSDDWISLKDVHKQSSDQKLISKARDRFYKDIISKTSCHVILTSDCSIYSYSTSGLKKFSDTESACGPFYSTNYHAVGARTIYTAVSPDFNLVFDPKFEDSLRWFFGFTCKNNPAEKPHNHNPKKRK